mmetsp:Transcript_11620/g.14219  ORF Transcript_11620/g.14219 Transcript_11620/m.14219 type:complete len:268 (+) Transcript_11620:639-1442(+)
MYMTLLDIILTECLNLVFEIFPILQELRFGRVYTQNNFDKFNLLCIILSFKYSDMTPCVFTYSNIYATVIQDSLLNIIFGMNVFELTIHSSLTMLLRIFTQYSLYSTPFYVLFWINNPTADFHYCSFVLSINEFTLTNDYGMNYIVNNILIQECIEWDGDEGSGNLRLCVSDCLLDMSGHVVSDIYIFYGYDAYLNGLRCVYEWKRLVCGTSTIIVGVMKDLKAYAFQIYPVFWIERQLSCNPPMSIISVSSLVSYFPFLSYLGMIK